MATDLVELTYGNCQVEKPEVDSCGYGPKAFKFRTSLAMLQYHPLPSHIVISPAP